MGYWNGKLFNEKDAKEGVYVFLATYYTPNDYKIKSSKGNIILIR